MSIEDISVHYLEGRLLKSKLIQSEISKHDKEPSWDGNIKFKYFKELGERFTKDGLAVVPVQVKGYQVKQFKNEKQIKYPVQIEDLKNYLNDNGVMFFVVYLDEEEREGKEIYYASLLPKRIEHELKRIKKIGQKTVKITFRKFPSECAMMENVIKDFIKHRELQPVGIIKKGLDIPELMRKGQIKTITFSLRGLKRDFSNLVDVVASQDFYLYGELKDTAITVPIKYCDKDFILAVGMKKIAEVIKGDKILKCEMNYLQDSDGGSYFEIGKIIRVDLKMHELKLKLEGSFIERLAELEFLNETLKKGKCILDGREVDFFIKNELLCEHVSNLLMIYRKISYMLEKMNIRKDLDLNSLNENGKRNLNMLIKAIVDKETVNGLKFKDKLTITYVDVANLHFLVAVEKINDNQYKIYDVNDYGDITYNFEDGQKNNGSIYFELKKLDFKHLDNISKERLLKDLQRVPNNEFVTGKANDALLQMLLAYDECPRVELMELMEVLSDWLVEQEENIYFQLNKLQVIKRVREFNFIEECLLYEIFKKSNDNELIMFACTLLLGHNEEAKKHFRMMSQSERDGIKEMPIMYFYRECEDI